MNAAEIGKEVIRWGCGQSSAAVAQSQRRIFAINRYEVLDMIAKGLDRSWVEKQLSLYEAAISAGGAKLRNRQLRPRRDLLLAILREWP